MGSPASHHMFRNFQYQKPVSEIKEAMERKITKLRDKIGEREGRIAAIREAHSISDADLINLLSQAADEAISNRRVASMSYNIQSTSSPDDVRIIAAGVVQNLVTEKSLIEQEKKSVEQLQLIVRNLGPVTHFGDNGQAYTQEFYHLSYDELDFLGF